MKKKENPFITIFTDASYCHMTKATGWAVWIKYGEGQTVKWSGGYQSKYSEHSTHAEKFAISVALWMCRELKKRKRINFNHKILVLQCDCKSALEMLRDARFNKLGIQKLKKKWVKGHSGKDDKRSWVNNWCDVWAKREMKKIRHKANNNMPIPKRLDLSVGWDQQ